MRAMAAHDPGHTGPAATARQRWMTTAALRRGVPWPLPALLAWLLAWGLCWAAGQAGLSAPWAAAAACALSVLLAAGWPALSLWRRGLVALGFPASALALGVSLGQGAGTGGGLPAWAWLLPLALLLLAYPMKAWRDAPLFPTPLRALQGLAQALPLRADARLLDAGCGLGHGLAALRGQWPAAQLRGIEWSWPLALAARWRCRRAGLQAQVRQGDMWRASWAGHDLVYVFQRPESMARAWQKAQAELAPGAWLVSLEFEVPGLTPSLRLPAGPERWLWAYQLGSAGAGSTLAARGR